MEEVRICPSCQAEMKLRYDGVLFMKTSQISPSPDCISVELYRCPRCRHLEWVEPLTAVEEFEKDQAEMEAVEDPAKKFEIIFEAIVNSFSKTKLAMTLTFSNNDWKKESELFLK